MVLLDSVFYDLHSDGKTNTADINLKTHYACVTQYNYLLHLLHLLQANPR